MKVLRCVDDVRDIYYHFLAFKNSIFNSIKLNKTH